MYIYLVNDLCKCLNCDDGPGNPCQNQCCPQIPPSGPSEEMDEVWSGTCFWDPNLGKWMCNYFS